MDLKNWTLLILQEASEINITQCVDLNISYPELFSKQGKAADCEVVKVPTEQWKKHKKAEFAKKFLWRLEMAGFAMVWRGCLAS